MKYAFSLVDPKQSGVPAQTGIQRQRAFSLVELSIVLVILGLLTGGILAGQSLIRAAELRSISTEFSRYIAATQTFRDKYFAIPGDMSNATSFWGKAAGTGIDSACADFASTSPATCNGNGDGRIGNAPEVFEEMRYWQHLANAGLIEGRYTGTYTSGAGYAFGVNTPQSKLSPATWYPWHFGNLAATTSDFGGSFGNVLEIGAWDGGATTPPVLRPDEAWNIDVKTDDGAPATGKTIAGKGTTARPCTSNANNISDANATYNLTNTGVICYLRFVNAY